MKWFTLIVLLSGCGGVTVDDDYDADVENDADAENDVEPDEATADDDAAPSDETAADEATPPEDDAGEPEDVVADEATEPDDAGSPDDAGDAEADFSYGLDPRCCPGSSMECALFCGELGCAEMEYYEGCGLCSCWSCGGSTWRDHCTGWDSDACYDGSRPSCG